MARMCLIGEADPFIARLLTRFGEESKLETICARTGEELLILAQQTRPDLIVLDAELPGDVRGWKAVQTLGCSPALAEVPIIVCSWLPEAEAHSLTGPVSGYLSKPDLHYADFVSVLQAIGFSSAAPAGKPGWRERRKAGDLS